MEFTVVAFIRYRHSISCRKYFKFIMRLKLAMWHRYSPHFDGRPITIPVPTSGRRYCIVVHMQIHGYWTMLAIALDNWYVVGFYSPTFRRWFSFQEKDRNVPIITGADNLGYSESYSGMGGLIDARMSYVHVFNAIKNLSTSRDVNDFKSHLMCLILYTSEAARSSKICEDIWHALRNDTEVANIRNNWHSIIHGWADSVKEFVEALKDDDKERLCRDLGFLVGDRGRNNPAPSYRYEWSNSWLLLTFNPDDFPKSRYYNREFPEIKNKYYDDEGNHTYYHRKKCTFLLHKQVS